MNVVVNEDCQNLPQVRSCSKHQQSHLLPNALMALGYDESALPVADLLAQVMGLEGSWVIVSPVHWEATHNDAYIHQVGSDLGLSVQELQGAFDAYADFLAEDGFTLKYYDESMWLLQLDSQSPPHSKSVYQTLNQSLMSALQLIDESHYWQKFITESQMFFALLPTQSKLNGVWVWGGDKRFQTQSVKIFADTQLQALASHLSSQVVLYEKNSDLMHCELVLLESSAQLSDEHRKQLERRNVHWYWNDCRYTVGRLNWFHRLWRTFVHAN